MKFLIAFALFAVAAALPDPISLPKAALPAFEEDAFSNAEPLDLPQPELPAYEDAVHVFEAIDILPLFVPEEVMEQVRLAQLPEIEPQPVKFVDNAEDIVPVDAMAYDEVPAEAVRVVESPEAVEAPIDADDFAVRVVEIAQNAVPLAEESFAVRVVDNAEDIPASFDEQLAAVELEAINVAEEVIPDAVRVVDAPLGRPGKIFANPILR